MQTLRLWFMTAGKTPKSTSHSKVNKLVLLILTLQILIKTDEKFDYGVINGDLEMRTSGSSSWKTLFLVFRVYFRKSRLELWSAGRGSIRGDSRWIWLQAREQRCWDYCIFLRVRGSCWVWGLNEWTIIKNHQQSKSSTLQGLRVLVHIWTASRLVPVPGNPLWSFPSVRPSLLQNHDLHPGLYFHCVRQVAGR